MGAAREKDQADFDLERFINLFDEAMTSKDPRVIETLRSLMMIVTLTRPETGTVSVDRHQGPLRRLFEDMHNLNRRVSCMEEEQYRHERERSYSRQWPDAEDKYTLAAAANMAQTIDRDVMRQLSKSTAMAINGGLVPQNVNLPTKGLLKK
jgi:hypothetical protein